MAGVRGAQRGQIEAKIAWPGSGPDEAYRLVTARLREANAQLDQVYKEYRDRKTGRCLLCYPNAERRRSLFNFHSNRDDLYQLFKAIGEG